MFNCYLCCRFSSPNCSHLYLYFQNCRFSLLVLTTTLYKVWWYFFSKLVFLPINLLLFCQNLTIDHSKTFSYPKAHWQFFDNFIKTSFKNTSLSLNKKKYIKAKTTGNHTIGSFYAPITVNFTIYFIRIIKINFQTKITFQRQF